MKKLIILIPLMILISSSGCGDKKVGRAEGANSESETKPTRFIVVGIDESGSYELWNPVKKTIMSLIRQLKPGDILYLRRINSASYLDDCTVFRLEIPKISGPENVNPFDRKAKIYRASLINHINSLKKEACKRVSDAEFKNSRHTDIYGFLAAAGDRFNLVSKTCPLTGSPGGSLQITPMNITSPIFQKLKHGSTQDKVNNENSDQIWQAGHSRKNLGGGYPH